MQLALNIDVPDHFTEGAQKAIHDGVQGIATTIVAEAATAGVTTGVVNDDVVMEAYKNYAPPKSRWQKFVNLAGAAATFIGGALTAIVPIIVQTVSDDLLPWLILSGVLGAITLLCLTFIVYRGT